MDEIIYNAFGSYYNVLEKLGYISYPQSQKLLLLCFYRDFVFQDYKGLLKKEDYYLIERALDCLWGSTCLIPYPDYLKMGKLHIGEMTEMAQRVKNLEDTSVLKAFDAEGASGDIIITAEEEEK